MPVKIEKYGIQWPGLITNLEIERQMCRRGGRWQGKHGVIGNGMKFHFMEFQKRLYGKEKLWHKWNILQTELYVEHRVVGVIGGASSGKSNSAATDLLADWLIFPECTTVIVCSTTKERMQDRIFGEVKKYFRIAKDLNPQIPGHAIDGRMRIVYEQPQHFTKQTTGRDYRNGIIGIPILSGGEFRGIQELVGIKNKRVRAVIDELQFIPKSVIMALSNLDKNEDFKLLGLGNVKESTDALGQLCEPANHLGGWDGGIDQEPITKHWETTRPGGVCLQLVGTDSPNLDGKLGIPIITQSAIDRDIEQYGKDSLQFTMMNQGMMPKGQGARRVLTTMLCRKHKAFDEPAWQGERIKIGFLDAAYRGVGGDRCIFGEIQFGPEMQEFEPTIAMTNLIAQDTSKKPKRYVLALIGLVVVPVDAKKNEEAEQQITAFLQTECATRGIAPENFFYDAGMRTGLVNAIANNWSTKTNPIDCGGSPSDRMVSAQIQKPCNKYYSKFITEIWFNVRMCIEAGQFRGMTNDVVQEFAAREWTMVSGNKIEVETKEKMKEKVGRSPDKADAVAIGVLGAIRKGFVIDSLKPVKEKREKRGWAKNLQDRARAQWNDGSLTYSGACSKE